jgi:hypothetical protein
VIPKHVDQFCDHVRVDGINRNHWIVLLEYAPTVCGGGQMASMGSNIVRDKTIILNNDKGQNSHRLQGGADGNYGIQNFSR